MLSFGIPYYNRLLCLRIWTAQCVSFHILGTGQFYNLYNKHYLEIWKKNSNHILGRYDYVRVLFSLESGILGYRISQYLPQFWTLIVELGPHKFYT